MALGTIMFAVGGYLLKQAKSEGIVINALVGIPMMFASFIVSNVYALAAILIVGILAVKYFDF